MVDERESFEAHEMENLKPSEEQEEEEDEEEEVEEEEEGEESERGSGGEPRSLESEVGGELRASQSETLAVRPSSEVPEKDRCGGVKVNSTSKSNGGDQSEEQVGKPPEEVLAVTVVHDAGVQTENQHQSTGCRNSLELSPTSVTQPISSAPSPTTIDHKLSPPQDNDLCRPKADRQNSLALKTMTPISAVKIPSSDGYNWRKYGQKQVKSPKGSRSYYKCTYSECFAKKIECSDHSGCVTEVVYKSQHTHDPPKKNSSAKEKFSSAERVSGNNVTKQHWRVPKDSYPSTSAKQSTHETPLCPDRKRQSLANSDENGNTMLVKNEDDNEPEPKRRLKKSHLEDLGSLLKPSKKSKFVVHAAGDVGISADGYRWRKYGQKMVKGNPHPRNYYRCTSAGCPVRKHIETAVDNTDAMIITYKGVHDHDMPVPKKRHGPPSAPLVAAAAPASMNNVLLKKSETVQNPTKWSVDNEGELAGEAMDLGGEKAMESARTLLSIGFEIKPC